MNWIWILLIGMILGALLRPFLFKAVFWVIGGLLSALGISGPSG